MAQTYSTELAGIASVPAVKPSATAGYGARLKRFRATVALAAQAAGAGNEIVVGLIPAGYTYAFGVVNSDTSLGTATLSIGTPAAPTKYNAGAQTLTAVNAPALFGAVAGEDQSVLTVEERVQILVGTAALPAAGTLVVDLFFSSPN